MQSLNVKERIAYVRGLIEGSEFHGRDERAQSIWSNLLTVCDTMADSIDSLWQSVEDVEEYLDAIDADLTDLEEDLTDEALDLIDIECGHCGHTFSIEEGFLEDEHVEIMCPSCGREVGTGELTSEPVLFTSQAGPPDPDSALQS